MRKKEIILNKYNRQELLQQYNKYDLDMKKVRKLRVGDESKIHKPLFWRNDVINAWCISGAVGTVKILNLIAKTNIGLVFMTRNTMAEDFIVIVLLGVECVVTNLRNFSNRKI